MLRIVVPVLPEVWHNEARLIEPCP